MQTTLSTAAPFETSSINRRILNAVLWVSAAGVLVKIAAVFKEIAVAGVYGRTDAMDAFLAAALIPGLLVNLISESMNQALAPTLVRVREREGHEQAQQLLSSAMLWMCLLLVAASAAMALAARGFFPLIASHFPAPKLDLSIRLFYALLPVVLITGIATNCTAVLNTFDRFALPALAPIVISAAILVGRSTLGPRLGIWAMVWSTLAGSLLHAVLVAWMMHRHGYRFLLRWYGMNEATRTVGRQYGPVLVSGVVASGGLLVDQSMAAMLAAGQRLGAGLCQPLRERGADALAGAISTAVVPYFSRMVAHRDWAGCRETLRTWVWRTAAVSTPIAAVLIAGSHPIVRLAYQHGAFSPADTAVVAGVLAMYAIQIPFFVVSRVYYRFLIAMLRTDLVLWCGVINLGLDVILNLILMRWMGVAGIALATSLWTVSTFFFLRHWTRVVLRRASLGEQKSGVVGSMKP